MWRLSRPSELNDLVNVIRQGIDESPAGLRTREIFAEVIFGPYGLPAADIREGAPDIIDVIETHPYVPHRARLLDSVLAGWEGRDIGRHRSGVSGALDGACPRAVQRTRAEDRSIAAGR